MFNRACDAMEKFDKNGGKGEMMIEFGGKKKKGSYISSLLLIFSLYKSGKKKKEDRAGEIGAEANSALMKVGGKFNAKVHFIGEDESDDEGAMHFKIVMKKY